VFAIPIRNSKAATLIEAIATMKKTKGFQTINVLLFDGESALASKHVQKQIRQQLGINVIAQPHFKRNMAERAIRELKLRTAIALDLEGNQS